MESLDQIKWHPLVMALNPHGRQFMRAVELPEELNRYAKNYDIRMFALIPFGVFPHIKAIPAFQMLWDDVLQKRYEGKDTLVVPSSGNTAHGVIRLARAFGFTKVKVPMSNDVPASKTGVLRAFGDWVDVLQVGHPVELIRELETLPGHYHLDQYSHPGNNRAHRVYTGPEIDRVIGRQRWGRELSVVAVAMGSGGTALGLAEYFETKGAATTVVGVRPKDGEQVPGARNKKAMKDVVRLPWDAKVRAIEEVDRREAFRRTRRLWSAVEPQPGPTSGMAWAGLDHYLSSVDEAQLERLCHTNVGFLCPDDGRFYSDLMLSELDPNEGAD